VAAVMAPAAGRGIGQRDVLVGVVVEHEVDRREQRGGFLVDVRLQPFDELQRDRLQHGELGGVEASGGRGEERRQQVRGGRPDRPVLVQQQVGEVALAAGGEPRKQLLLLEAEVAVDLAGHGPCHLLREQREPFVRRAADRNVQNAALEPAEQREALAVLLVELPRCRGPEVHRVPPE